MVSLLVSQITFCTNMALHFLERLPDEIFRLVHKVTVPSIAVRRRMASRPTARRDRGVGAVGPRRVLDVPERKEPRGRGRGPVGEGAAAA
jgi:hypothetical protein